MKVVVACWKQQSDDEEGVGERNGENEGSDKEVTRQQDRPTTVEV